MKYHNVPLSKLNQIHFQVDGPTRLQSHQGAHNHMNAIPVRSKIKILSQHIIQRSAYRINTWCYDLVRFR